jgi:hypothetical protein
VTSMLAPDEVRGILVFGTSWDDESQRRRDLGFWDGDEFCTPMIEEFFAPVGDDWVVDDVEDASVLTAEFSSLRPRHENQPGSLMRCGGDEVR